MREFTSVDHVLVNGHPVYMIEAISGFNPRGLEGETVLIDGQPMKVIGVETYALIEPVSQPFGLMVDPL